MRCRLVACGIGVAAAGLATHGVARADGALVTFSAPHAARASAATLAPALERALEQAPAPKDAKSALDAALAFTASRLHFGLAHATSLAFDAQEREGNCVEYAHLFALAFDRLASRAHLTARAWVVHSADARLAGVVLPGRGMGEHDWALVVEPTPTGEVRRFVDPTFHDMGLPWDIAASVHGAVTLPPRR